MRRLAAVIPFAVVVAVGLFGFGYAGGWLGELAHGIYNGLVESGTAPRTAALAVLLGADALAATVVLAVSLVWGDRLPSGLPHVAFGVFLPLTLAATQARFFELAGSVGGLADSFGAYNFAAMFLLTIVVTETGVTLSRRRAERRIA